MENKENLTHDYLVCIDSDGCVFDTMEIKHKECFCPAAIEHFGLQPVSKYARDAWDFVNLYSQYRGIHRILALLKMMDLLEKRKEVVERGFKLPPLTELRKYVSDGGALSNAGLSTYLEAHPDAEDIRTTLTWSMDVNERIGRMVHGIPPFPHVRDGLEALQGVADVVIVSATQQLALEREWGEHDLLRLISAVKGQESGNKKQIIASLKARYAPDHILMIGDAPGDLNAAHDNVALFYPICPDQEAQSWKAFVSSLESFLGGHYAGEEERRKIEYFETILPLAPSWEETR